ncbi:hypothetical protein HMPREF0023_3195, partial [Acinetobacter sp. ATCC 27244]
NKGIENRFRENNKDKNCLVMGMTPLGIKRSFTALLSNNGGETKEG